MNSTFTPLPVLARLNVLATSDLHMHLSAYNYAKDTPSETVGLVKTATVIKSRRAAAEAENALTVLLDCGDGMQGTPMADFIATNQSLQRPHPLLQCFDTLGYDAATLGNHDFNYGLAFLQHTLAQTDTQFVCTNLATNDALPVVQHQILERHVTASDGQSYPLRIGVIGLLPPQTMKWDRALLDGKVFIHDIVLTGARHAKILKAQGADIVIALAHTGINQQPYTPMMENAALPLAKVDDIDVLVTGHTHLLLPGPHHSDIDGVDHDQGTLATQDRTWAKSA